MGSGIGVGLATMLVFLGLWWPVVSGVGVGPGSAAMVEVGEKEGSSVIFVPMEVSRRRRVVLCDSAEEDCDFFNMG